MNTLTLEQILGVVRHLFSAFGAVLAANGWTSQDEVEQLSGLVLTSVAIIWSIWSKSKS